MIMSFGLCHHVYTYKTNWYQIGNQMQKFQSWHPIPSFLLFIFDTYTLDILSIWYNLHTKENMLWIEQERAVLSWIPLHISRRELAAHPPTGRAGEPPWFHTVSAPEDTEAPLYPQYWKYPSRESMAGRRLLLQSRLQITIRRTPKFRPWRPARNACSTFCGAAVALRRRGKPWRRGMKERESAPLAVWIKWRVRRTELGL